MGRRKAAVFAVVLAGLTTFNAGCALLDEWISLAGWARENLFAGQPWWQIGLSVLGLGI